MKFRPATRFDFHRIQLLLGTQSCDWENLAQELSDRQWFRWVVGEEAGRCVATLRFEIYPDSQIALSTLIAAEKGGGSLAVQTRLFEKAAQLITEVDTTLAAAFDESGVLLTERAISSRRSPPELHPVFARSFARYAKHFGFESAKIAVATEDWDSSQKNPFADAKKLLISAYEPRAQRLALDHGYEPILYLPAFHLTAEGLREDRILVARSV